MSIKAGDCLDSKNSNENSSLAIPFCLFLIFCCVFCALSAHAQEAEFDKLTGEESPGLINSDNSSTGQIKQELTAISDDIKRLNDKHQRRQASLNREKGLVRDEILKLKKGKEHLIIEMVSGLVCSRCKKTKTDIENSGEDFWTHIRRVSGRTYYSTPKEIEAKVREYDRRIDEKIKEANALMKERDEEDKEYRSSVQVKEAEAEKLGENRVP